VPDLGGPPRETWSVARFRTTYRSTLETHLVDRGETSLRAAYELGREAIEAGLSVLDLAAAHHDALIAALRREPEGEHIEAVAQAASDFFLESLSAFEMIRRGFSEAQEAAILERRHAGMVRQLSNLLTDASLAFGASESLEEVLQLVAEQARELTNASCCLASTALTGGTVPIEVASYPDTAKRRWLTLLESGALVEIYGGLGSGRTSVRLTGDQLRRQLGDRVPVVQRDGALPAWLAASLRTLDGHGFGSIHLLDKLDGDFSELDEAVLVHLAQMAAAALERAHHYQRG
jgi:hypothetical protein